ncbi:DUF4832 domain-containing protein [Catenuloplanes japonicus]|uniref:DUF4832 domain-containing protein n=1 Tax=Catenuloplanes japonicus TaxID=33876 RepID=UPI000526F929|nr:DUF4832 domain-containing protein [Catenuloplanes japonicus]
MLITTRRGVRRLSGAVALTLLGGLGVAFATNASAAISEPAATSTDTDVTYRFAYTGEPQFARVYIDTDRSAATGFAQAGAGADYLLENGTLFRHAGGGWAWTQIGTVTHAHANGVATWTVPRAAIGETATPGDADLVFQVESPVQTSAKITQVYGSTPPPAGTISYAGSDEVFANPERGFYHHSGECDSATYDEATLRAWRTNEQVSLMMCVFYLRDFKTTPISTAALTHLQQQFTTVRAAGLKMVLRFAYTDLEDGADATKDRVLAHLDQLRPYLQANADVIEVMQSGFVGAWGEGYYTQNFGNNGVVTAADWANRKAVHDKILSVLPETRMVQLRTPAFKRTMYPSGQSRTGHHNDCFLASDTDFGTYTDIAVDYPYLEAETRTVAMGGETCAPNPPRSQCATATAEMSRFHWTYLNTDYHPTVIAGFGTEGCLADIKRQLGYRFSLVSGAFPAQASRGGTLPVSITVRNDGWSAPINPRGAELVLRSTTTGTVTRLPLSANPRTWAAGTSTTVTQTLTVPSSIAAGSYELLLNLPDPLLANRAEYSVRTANAGTWEATTGFNKLNATVTVS